MAERMKMETINKADKNFEALKELFPNAITEIVTGYDEEGHEIVERAIDKDILMQEISCTVVDGAEERYQITWPNKRKAMINANAPIRKTLRPIIEKSRDFFETQNVYVKGDNLEVLKTMLEAYLGKVKMFYIDPPYNTGTDTLAYYDDYSMTDEEFISIGGFFDDDGNRIYSGRFRENPASNGRFHTDWLNMLYPTLRLAKDLLRDDGVIFISIDDNEAGNMKNICDEIFGAANYIETFYIQVRYASKSLNEKDDFQKLIEQVFVYAKNKREFVPSKPYEEYDLSKFCWEINEKAIGETMTLGGKKVTLFRPGEYEIKEVPYSIDALKETWASGSVLKGNTSGKFFDKQLSTRIEVDGYGCLYKVEGIGEDGIGYRYFTGPKKEGATKGKFYSGVPLTRRSEIESGGSRKYKPIINYYDFSGDFGNISHEGGVTFRGGKKPVKMLKQFLEIANVSDDDIVMDYFSGSASFAHAVLEYNNEKGICSKYILVQADVDFPEDSDYVRAGFKTICDLALTRLENIYDGTAKTGYRLLECDTSNMKEVYYRPADTDQTLLEMFADNIKPDRTPEDLLFQVMLDLGVLLSSKIEEMVIAEKKVFNVADGFLIACFDKDVTDETIKAVANMKPYYAVFRDDSMRNDSVATNFDQIFANISPDTIRKVL